MQVLVRKGFQFRHKDEKGNQKIHYEGEVFDLILEKGLDLPHSLEKVEKETKKADSK